MTGLGLDVVFPVLHGPFGEDGTVQGLLELANVAYVGAGVLASAVGMDKAFMKLAFAARGLPVAEYRVLRVSEWRTDRDRLIGVIQSMLGFPVFVKPANLGSSVGISKAKTRDQLATAIDLAFEFDLKVVVEAAVPAAREIEVGVLGNDDVEASVAGEVVPDREFYDYEAKYLDSASTVHIPAALDETQHADGPTAGHRRRFRQWMAPAWRASISCCRARPGPSTSTRSIPFPGSRRSACSRSCGPPRASITRRCSIG